MPTATLGGLIKDYRIKKRLSQLEVSLRIGWKETSRLSKIEQGRVGKPTRETIDKIIEALELTGSEKGEFLLVGGYLPTEEEILEIRKKTQELLNDWPYPATILDLSWRVIDENKATEHIYQLDKVFINRIMNEHMRVLDILFDPHLVQNKVLKSKDKENWHMFLHHVTAHFKFEQRNRSKEKWYINFVKEMLSNKLFYKIWLQTKIDDMPKVIIGKFATKSILNPQDPKKMLSFYLFVVPVIEDPRFEMELLVPMDYETYKYFRK